MNAQGLFSIGGIASGLDTDNIVQQLMQLERQPIVRLEQRQESLRTAKDAWGQVNTRLSALRTATDQLRRSDRFDNMMSVTSSDPDAVSVTRGSGTVDSAQLSFTVEQLAQRMQQTSDDGFSGLDAQLGGRTLTLRDADGVDHDLTAGLATDATLDDLIGAVNDAGIGVRASALQVRPGEFQLVLDAVDTGLDEQFEIAEATGWDNAFRISQAAADARVSVGGIDVERGSNTITDLVEGATITLNSTTTSNVTVTAERDIDGAVAAVKGFVDAVNNTLNSIGELTAYDAETGRSGPLQGQFAVTQLAFQLRAAVTAPVEGLEGADGTASAVGISTGRDGRLSFDEAALRQAFTDDFEGTARRFSRAGEVSDETVATSVTGARSTQAGTYAVEVSKAAAVAVATGSPYSPPIGEPKTFMVRTPDGQTVRVEIDTTDTSAAQAALKIQQALNDAGATGLQATAPDADTLELTSTGVGEATSFRVWAVDENDDEIVGESVFGLEGTHTGTDVEGTIDGVAATGRGRTLTANAGPAEGLVVNTVADIDASETTPASFDVTFWQGIGGALDAQLARAEGVGGTIARARSSLDGQIELYQDRVDAFETRLESREITLRRQFVGLEVAMSKFNAQSQWLQGQLGQLAAMNAQAAQRR